MDTMLAFTIICIIFAVGDFISAKTKAILSVLFVASLVFLVLFWTGVLPLTIFDDSGIMLIAPVMLGLSITNMGTLMKFKEFLRQWKTVVLGLCIVVLGGGLMLLASTPFIGRENAIGIVGPITGGFVSAIIVGEVAIAKGFKEVMLLATLIVAVQGIIGYPLASFFVKKEALRLRKLFRAGTLNYDPAASAAAEAASLTAIKPKWQVFPTLSEKMQTPFILLGKCALIAFISFQLAGLTNGVINKYVMCLIIGVIAREVGFLEYDILKKANSYGFTLLAVMVMILVNLTKATVSETIALLGPLAISFVIGIGSLMVVALIVGKLLRYSWQMSLSIATTCLFGFPGTYVVSTEVANAVAQTPEEKQMLLDEILPKMIIAGFMTVTMSSVILAGFMAKLI